MLKILLKKQLMEVFKSYFYDAKKNKKRSKCAVILWFIMYGVIMLGVLGGMFTFLSVSMCGSLAEAGMDWLYFAILSGIAILLGAFGSIFSTYSGLYLSKDNDLLLSMPIPVRDIIISRLLNVYLMGVLYSSVVILPALIVYWVTVGVTAAKVICGILLAIILTLFVMILSCLLGWCVAKISLKLKNKSFITVLTSLLFIGLYYFVYGKANVLIQDLIRNAAVYGEKIRGAAYWLFRFGQIGEGDVSATLITLGITVALLVAVWFILKKTFLAIATASGNTGKKKYREQPVRQKSTFRALLGKEFSRFTASPNYMLNCGLGILFIPVLGVLMLIKGPEVMELLDLMLDGNSDYVVVILCTAFFALSAMNDMATPSVSLEGKSIWQLQSLPVEPKAVLRAKTLLQLILSGIPLVFTLICGVCILHASVPVKLLICLLTLVNTVFAALFSSFLGIRMPNLSWTNEVVPIKQSGAVLISMFGSWGITAVFTAVYFLIGYKLGVPLYLGIWTAVYAAASIVLARWLDTKGAKRFAAL